MPDRPPQTLLHSLTPVSDWVKRWSHLVAPQGTVLDIACGHGRNMKWFSQRGHQVTGIDRSSEAINAAAAHGNVVLADIENGPWPLMDGTRPRQFAAVIVTNYLWRPLFPLIEECIAPGGLLVYETFSKGQETVGRPTSPDFLLQPAELLRAFERLRIISFEEGFVEDPPRFLQRIAAKRSVSPVAGDQAPERYML